MTITPTDIYRQMKPKDKKIDYLDLTENDISEEIGYSPGPYVCVPLEVGTEKVGSLCVLNPRKKRQFTQDQIELLYMSGQCAATAIKSAKEREDALLKTETLTRLHEVTESMLKILDFDNRLKIIAQNAFDVLSADIVVLYVFDEKIGDVRMPPVFIGKQINNEDRLKKRGPHHEDSVVFELLERKKAFYAPNAPKDWFEHFFSAMGLESLKDHFIEREEIASSAGIPLHVEDEPVGVLFVNYRIPQYFRKQQTIRIETFANEAALAIRNARLFSQRERYLRELDVLYQIVQEISSSMMLQIPEILDLIYKQTSKLLTVSEYFFVALYDKVTDTVSFEYAVVENVSQKTGIGEWKSRTNGKGLSEYLMKLERKAFLIPKNLPQWFEEHKDMVEMIGTKAKCWLGAPMIYKTDIIGAIGMQSNIKENAYNDDDKKFLEIIASQAAIAIAEARLFQKSQSQAEELYELYQKKGKQTRELNLLNQRYKRQAEEVDQLYKISQEIVEKSTSFSPVLDTILEKAVELSKADGGQIYLYDEKTGELKMTLSYKSKPLEGLVIPRGEGMTGTVARENSPKFTNDYFNSEYAIKELNTPDIRRLIKGMCQLPLLWQDEFLGVLSLTRKPKSKLTFQQRDVALLDHFAKPAAIAISLAKHISFRQSILDDNPEAIIAIDRIGNIIQFNRSSERITGFSREEITGKPGADYYYDRKPEARRIMKSLREQFEKDDQKTVSNIKTAVRGKKGERIPISLTAKILKDDLGNDIGSIGFMRDLRELKFLDSEYRSEQDFLAEIELYPQNTPIDNPEDLQNHLTQLLKMTLTFCKLNYIILFGSTKENDTVLKAVAWYNLPSNVMNALPHFNWKKAELLTVENDSEYMLEDEIKTLKGWSPNSFWQNKIKMGIRGNNKNYFKELSCGVPVRLADNYRAVLIFGPFVDSVNLMERVDLIRNIGQTININALSWLQALYLRSKTKEAERSSKLIVHRTKTILQQIVGKFSLIQRRADNKTEFLEYAKEGEILSSHLGKVATRALFSHIAELEEEDYDFQDYPLPALIQNCAEGFHIAAKEKNKKIKVDSKVEDLPYAYIDPVILSVAMGNLIDNALKYSRGSTVIKIYTECDTREVTIFVQNIGRELPESARNNFQQPGQRWPMNPEDENIPGTGFGLWDSSVIVRAHQGELDFSSVKLENSRNFLVKVWMTLPLKRRTHKN